MSTSSRMRVTGFSGMDVESMVQQLMDAESLKLNKHKREVTKTEWKIEAYRNQATALKAIKTNYLQSDTAKSKMTMMSSFSNFKNSVKLSGGGTSSAVSIGTSPKTKAGTYKVDTFSVASGASVKAQGLGMSSTSATDLDDIAKAIDGGAGFKMTVGGTTEEIKFGSGELSALGINTSDGMTDAETTALEDAINKKLEVFGTQYEQGTTAAQIQAGNATREGKIRIDLSADSVSFATSTSQPYTLAEDGGNSGLIGKMGLQAGSSDYTQKKLSDIDPSFANGVLFDIGGKTINITDADATVQDVLNAINEEEGITVKASYDAYKKEFTFTSTKTGRDSSLGLANADDDFGKIFGITEDVAKKAKGTDSVVQITDQNGNQRIIESSSATINDEATGLNLTVNSMAAETLEISVEKDTTKTVDMIKEFVESYNKVLSDLRGSVNTRRAKSDTYTYYEPLLEEEKESLKDTQIEKMEAKAKQGLLYRDSALTQIVDQMETMMMESVTLSDGSKLSLADIGITTTKDYTKGGELVIDEEKLTAYLEENADKVGELFTKAAGFDSSGGRMTVSGIFNGTVNANDKMKSEGISQRLLTIIDLATDRSLGSITQIAGNDALDTQSDLYEELKEKNQKIELMIAQLNKKEENYYRKFNAMETAMSKANNQVSSLLASMGQ